jgi:HEAT repeat protein
MPSADAILLVSALCTQLESQDPLVRARAATALADHPDDLRAFEALRTALRDKTAAVREAATASLDRLIAASPEHVAWLVQHYENEGHAPLARFLARLGTPEAIEPLFESLHDAGPKERTTLLDAIAVSDRVPTGWLLSQLESRLAKDDIDDTERARLLAEILSLRGVDRGSQVLLDDFTSQTVVETFIARGPDGIRTLCRVLATCDPFSQDPVIEWFAAKRKLVEATVYAVLEDRSSAGDAAAVRALGFWDDPRSVEALLRVANDDTRSREVRDHALESLCRLEAPEAIDTLCAAMVDAEVDGTTRWTCAGALGDIGNAAALPALEALVKSKPGGQLERVAKEAIERIG